MPYAAGTDPYANYPKTPLTPARQLVAVALDDSNDLVVYAKALRVYVPSTIPEALVVLLPLDAADASPITLKFTPGVWVEPIMIRRVLATGTTAGLGLHAYQG